MNSRRRAGELLATIASQARRSSAAAASTPTIGSVQGDALVALSALVGLVVGVLAGMAFRFSDREREVPDAPDPATALPVGAADVLAVLSSSAVVVNAAGDVIQASPAAYAFGIVRGGRVLSPELLDLTRQVQRDGEIRQAELELSRGPLGGGTVSVLARVAPLGASLTLALIEDRTEAKRVEAVRRDFVANVSHELKTPVGAVALLAEAIIGAADDPEAVRRFAERMQTEAGRLTRLVQDVINLSRLQGHDPLSAPGLVVLDEVIAETVDRSRLQAETRQITLASGGDTGVHVRGDAHQLCMALANLVDNAVRHSPSGGRVTVAVRRVADSGNDIAEVSVSDEGPGIPAEERERVFERFYRIDEARSRNTGGTGLGLAIAKHVAVNHGGEVALWSDEGTGSTFTLRLPAAGSRGGGAP